MNNQKPFYPFSSFTDKTQFTEEARDFWASEKGVAANNELLMLLSEKPINMAELGSLARTYGITGQQKVPGKMKAYLEENASIETRGTWCGLKGRDNKYWEMTNALKQGKVPIPLAKPNVLYHWGILSTKEAIFDGEIFALKDASHENVTPENAIVNISFPRIKKGQIIDFKPGDFITATQIGDDQLRLCYNIELNWTPFMVRTWEDFAESQQCDSLEKYLSSEVSSNSSSFTPKYTTRYPKVLIHDHGKLFAGFHYSRNDNRFFANEIVRSIDDFIGIESFSHSFRVLNYPKCRIQFEDDEFTLVVASNWNTFNDFIADSKFWEVRKPVPPVPPTPDPVPTMEWPPEEIAFLDRFEQYVADCGFKYDDRDLARFHTSVKCGMLTLLGGEPGTGKSSLVELYFRALGGSDNNRESENSFLRVDVNPSWMEPADLIGFRDQNKVFRPAENGLFNRLRKWNDEDGDRNHLWPICLEEINLACVEHYFSDFIQIISRGNGCLKYERKVLGDDSPNADDSEIKCSDGDIASEECAIRLTDNLRFVGTCNSDETTRSLSLRFLDRCTMIELSLSDEMKERLLDDAFAGRTAKVLPYELEQGHEVSANDFQKWTNHDAGNLEEVKKLLSGLMASFEKAGIAPSPRVIAEIAKYIRNRPPWGIGEGMSSEQDRIMCALDECIAQRILSHYRSSPMTIPALRELTVQFQNLGLELAFEVGSRLIESFNNMMIVSDIE